MSKKKNIKTLAREGGVDSYGDLPDTAAKSKRHTCKLESFKAVDYSKLKSGSLGKMKGIETRSRNIQEADRLEKEKISRSEELKFIKKLQIKHLNYKTRRYQQISSFSEISALPTEGEQIKMVTQQQINAFTLILMLQQQIGIKSIYITTYNFSSVVITSLMSLLAEGCSQMTIVCNESMRLMMPKRYLELMTALQNYPTRLRVAIVHNHTKIACVQTIDDRYYVIEGSGNFSDNVKIEQYLFEQSKPSFEFHQTWIEQLFSTEYKKMKRDEIHQ